MRKWLHKIPLLIAVAIILGHNAIPHHHHTVKEVAAAHHSHDHDEDANSDHHDKAKDDHHNIFTFAQLDEDFVPAKFCKVHIDLSLFYVPIPEPIHGFMEIKEPSKTTFSFYREYPPPGGHYPSALFSRPPPAC